MYLDEEPLDKYEALAAWFDFDVEDGRSGGRRQKSHVGGQQRHQQKISELAEAPETLEDEFRISYKPSRHEAVWLRDSLRPFVVQGLIEDVLALVKGGKEANVYLCQAPLHTGRELVAAKVYRPRQFRNLRNDKLYREGRELLNPNGLPIKNRDNREMRAINNNTAFGAQLKHISWLMHEYLTLDRLYRLGAAVPTPIASGENAILMEYIGDRRRPAPLLHGVALAKEQTQSLFEDVMRNVELMLSHGMIHGDLSAYNILYWQGDVTIIDFPQVTLSESNHNANHIFRRDVRRVCEYFALQGLEVDADAIGQRLWSEHVSLPPDRTVQDAL